MAVLWFLVAAECWAQPGAPPTATQASAADLAHGRKLLAMVRDNVLSFDDPAFYWFCEYVRRSNAENLGPDPGETPLPWKFLLERPGDYRGEPVVIEGTLQSHAAWEDPHRPQLGRLHQYELSDVGTRALCTVIAVEDAGAIPVRSRVRAKGYFIKVRAFRTAGGDSGAGPLLVAGRIEVAQAALPGVPGTRLPQMRVMNWLLGATAAMAVVWLVLRRRLQRPTGTRMPGARLTRGAPTGSDDDFAWLTQRDDRPRDQV